MLPDRPLAVRAASARPSIFTQIFALVLASSAVALLLNLGLLAFAPNVPSGTWPASQVAAAIRDEADWLAVQRVPGVEAGERSESPAARRLALRTALLLDVPPGSVRAELSTIQNSRTVLVHGGGPLPPQPAFVGHFRLWVADSQGGYLLYEPRELRFLDNRERRYLLLFLISGLVMLPVAWLVARWLSEPFEKLADAADRLGRDPGAAPPDVIGPAEVTRASDALIRMQQRLGAYVSDRTRMLAAIAHDLRTPLTRLAFRIEGVPPPLGDQMAADVEEMRQMLAATMGFARSDQLPHERTPLDIAELVGEVADEMALTGRQIYAPPPGSPALTVMGDRIALRRLFANLFDNGENYGGAARATIRRTTEPEMAVIDIDDDGPGLPPQELERLFDPFHRLEGSRSRGTGGIGLGLSVARSIARAHGGDVVLLNRAVQGARARVTLPLER